MRTLFCCVALAVSLVLFNTAAAEARPEAMPEFQVTNWIGEKSVTWEELQGKPYVLEFWATWCPPCRRSIPHLVELSRVYEPLGIPIIGLTTEPVQQKEQIEAFAAEYNMVYHVGFDPGIGRQLNVRSIPHAFVVDAAGKIAWAGNPLSPDFDKELEKTAGSWLFSKEDYPDTRELAVGALTGASEGAVGRLKEMKAEGDEEAAKALEKLNQLALRMIDAADSLKEEDPAEYVVTFDKLAARFAGLEAAEEARKRASEAREAPGVADDVAALQGLRSIVEELQDKIAEIGRDAEDRDKALARILPLLEQAVKEMDALIAKYPDAKRTEDVRQERGEIKTALESFQRITPNE